MVFVGVEFHENDGGGIALVNQEWITPQKSEVFWPPHKNKEKYYKSLKNGDTPDENTWPMYKILRTFFVVDDYDKALKKIKEAEVTSDLQSEVEHTDDRRPKRIKHVCRKLYNSSDDEDDDVGIFERPPPLKAAKHLHDHSVNTPGPSFKINTPLSSRSSSIIERQVFLEKEDSDSTNKIVINLLQQIKEQNKEILHELRKQNRVTINAMSLPDLPVELPLQQEQELNILENVLSDQEKSVALSCYLSTLGGRDTTALTNNILKRCLTNQLACNYSFRGKGVKKAFANLCLNRVVISAVKSKNPQSLERDIEDHIKVWLKHSPQRHKIEYAKERK